MGTAHSFVTGGGRRNIEARYHAAYASHCMK